MAIVAGWLLDEVFDNASPKGWLAAGHCSSSGVKPLLQLVQLVGVATISIAEVGGGKPTCWCEWDCIGFVGC